MSARVIPPPNAPAGARRGDDAETFPRFATAGLVLGDVQPPAPAPGGAHDIQEAIALVDAYFEEEQRIAVERSQPPVLTWDSAATALLRQLARAWCGLNRFVDAVSDLRVREDLRRDADRLQASRPALAAMLRRAANRTWIVD